MKYSIENYHELRFSALAERLTKNNFDVRMAENSQAAVNIVINEIVSACVSQSRPTCQSCGLRYKSNPNCK